MSASSLSSPSAIDTEKAKKQNKLTAAGKKTRDCAQRWFGDFKNFINQGNVLDLAIAVIVGAAFGAIIMSLVDDIIGPIIGLVTEGSLSEIFVVMRQGDTNTTRYKTRQIAKDNGAITLNYGNFCQAIINFFIIAICMFFLVKVIYLTLRKQVSGPAEQVSCPDCSEPVKETARRCPHCTSWIGEHTEEVLCMRESVQTRTLGTQTKPVIPVQKRRPSESH